MNYKLQLTIYITIQAKTRINDKLQNFSYKHFRLVRNTNNK